MINTDTVRIDVHLVQQLIALQFPQWAHLPIKPVEFGGWDNRTFHLGRNMSVRLPSGGDYADKVAKEQHWLPILASSLPLAIPTPLAMGKPAANYLWPWSVYSWIEGDTAAVAPIHDRTQFAITLAEFLVALQRIDVTNGPVAGEHNFYRGGNLAVYDAETRLSIAKLGDLINVEAVTTVWNAALASTWQYPPVWVHGDIAVGNLLVNNGHLSAVIDFGGLAIGDPACDLVMNWTWFSEESRVAFRTTLNLDEATWARARGWALWKALIVCAALPGTNSAEQASSWRVLEAVLADSSDNR